MRYLLTVVVWAAFVASFLFWYHRRPRQKTTHYWADDIPTAKFETKFLEEYESRK